MIENGSITCRWEWLLIKLGTPRKHPYQGIAMSYREECPQSKRLTASRPLQRTVRLTP